MHFSVTTPDGQLPPPAVCEALQELVQLAAAHCGWSKPDFKVLEEPPQGKTNAEHDAADNAAGNQ